MNVWVQTCCYPAKGTQFLCKGIPLTKEAPDFYLSDGSAAQTGQANTSARFNYSLVKGVVDWFEL